MVMMAFAVSKVADLPTYSDHSFVVSASGPWRGLKTRAHRPMCPRECLLHQKWWLWQLAMIARGCHASHDWRRSIEVSTASIDYWPFCDSTRVHFLSTSFSPYPWPCYFVAKTPHHYRADPLWHDSTQPYRHSAYWSWACWRRRSWLLRMWQFSQLLDFFFALRWATLSHHPREVDCHQNRRTCPRRLHLQWFSDCC